MTGFIAHLPPASVAAERISSEPFWPDIPTDALRSIARLDGNVTPDILRAAIVQGVLHVNNELRAWATAQQQAGHATLADVPAPHINGQSARVHAYLHAVCSAAMAHLENDRRAQATLPAGMGKDARVLESVALRTADHWQNMRHAIADVMQRMRETVTLI